MIPTPWKIERAGWWWRVTLDPAHPQYWMVLADQHQECDGPVCDPECRDPQAECHCGPTTTDGNDDA